MNTKKARSLTRVLGILLVVSAFTLGVIGCGKNWNPMASPKKSSKKVDSDNTTTITNNYEGGSDALAVTDDSPVANFRAIINASPEYLYDSGDGWYRNSCYFVVDAGNSLVPEGWSVYSCDFSVNGQIVSRGGQSLVFETWSYDRAETLNLVVVLTIRKEGTDIYHTNTAYESVSVDADRVGYVCYDTGDGSKGKSKG